MESACEATNPSLWRPCGVQERQVACEPTLEEGHAAGTLCIMQLAGLALPSRQAFGRALFARSEAPGELPTLRAAPKPSRARLMRSYRAVDKDTMFEVAWHELPLGKAEQVDDRAAEAPVPEHENLLKVVAKWEEPGPPKKLVVITEMVDAGTLQLHIERIKDDVRVNVVKKWCRQILSGLQHLHVTTGRVSSGEPPDRGSFTRAQRRARYAAATFGSKPRCCPNKHCCPAAAFASPFAAMLPCPPTPASSSPSSRSPA